MSPDFAGWFVIAPVEFSFSAAAVENYAHNVPCTDYADAIFCLVEYAFSIGFNVDSSKVAVSFDENSRVLDEFSSCLRVC